MILFFFLITTKMVALLFFLLFFPSFSGEGTSALPDKSRQRRDRKRASFPFVSPFSVDGYASTLFHWTMQGASPCVVCCFLSCLLRFVFFFPLSCLAAFYPVFPQVDPIVALISVPDCLSTICIPPSPPDEEVLTFLLCENGAAQANPSK